MLVGEIGIPRREFLYDIQFWEARRIIRGYRRRHILHYQLQRINAWASMFCMGNPKHMKPQDVLPLFFDDDLDEDDEMNSEINYTDEEIAQMRAEMENAAELFRQAGTD